MNLLKKLLRQLLRYLFAHWQVALWISGCLALFCNFIFFFPGYMSNDSILMYYAARGDVPSDLAPVMLGLIWRVLYQITGQMSSLLFLQLAMLWSSLCLFATYVFKKSKSRKYSLMVLAIGILPFVFNISGVIWRDCQMVFALMLATSLILWFKEIKNVWRRVGLFILIILLIMYAAVSRYNAIIAVVPMVFLAVRNSGFVKKTYVQVFLAVLSIPLVFIFLLPSINSLMGATKSNNQPGLLLDDIVRVSDKDVLSSIEMPVGLRASLLKIQDCSINTDRLVDNMGFCADNETRVILYQNYNEFQRVWLQIITSNPFRYIKYKATMYLYVLFPVKSYIYVWQDGIVANRYNITVKYDFLRVIGFAYTNFFSRYLRMIYEPWFWLVSGLALLYASARKRGIHVLLTNTLCVSGVLYILGYIPTGVAPDYRYIYWPVLAIIIAFVLYILDNFGNKIVKIKKLVSLNRN